MTPSRIAAIAALALGLTTVWAGSLTQSESEQTIADISDFPGEGRYAALEEQFTKLRSELDNARSERHALAEEIVNLRAELDSLSAAQAPANDEPIAAADPDPPEPPESETPKQDKTPVAGVFDVAALLELGLAEAEVARLLESYESSQMEELYLRDTATREDWIKTKRFRDELQEVQNRLRDSMSDDDFDRMLYASGKKNRVILTHVIQDSPAKDAGLQKGDFVLSYNDVRIFKSVELQRATTLSTSNQTPMIILRGGEQLRVFLPAGPLGVQLGNETVAPLF